MDDIIERLENVLAYMTSDTALRAIGNSFIDCTRDLTERQRFILLSNTPGYDRACDAHSMRVSKLKYSIKQLKSLRDGEWVASVELENNKAS